MATNQELIMKALTVSDFTTGRLNRKQSTAFLRLVRAATALLPEIRKHTMTQQREEINRLHLGEPITVSASEGVGSTSKWQAKNSAVNLDVNKIRSDWDVTTEVFQDNIEQNNFEQTIIEMASERIGQDMELLAIQGDSSITATDALSLLLKTDDGYDVLTESAHILDAGAEPISKGLLMAGLRRMPKQYKNDPNLAWIMSDGLAEDWIERVSDRGTALGDSVLNSGTVVKPFGKRIIVVPNIPDTKAVTVTAVLPAETTSAKQGPYIFTATASTIKIDSTNVTFSVGTLQTVEVAKAINDAVAAVVAFVAEDGKLTIQSATTGSGASFIVAAGDTNDALSIIDLTAATFTGNDAGVSATANDASFIWLANPNNFIHAILDGPRMFSEFNRDLDQIEFTMFNQVDMQIENLDAIVKIKNVRKLDLF